MTGTTEAEVEEVTKVAGEDAEMVLAVEAAQDAAAGEATQGPIPRLQQTEP